MYLQFINENFIQFDSLPERIRLADGMTRTSLQELSIVEREAIGLIEYQDITNNIDIKTHRYTQDIIFDHPNKTYERVTEQIPFETLRYNKKIQYLLDREVLQSQGFQTTTGAQLRLKVDEEDLVRWTQLMMKIMAFQAPTEIVWDFYDEKHVLASAEVTPMLAEVSNWFADFMSETKEHVLQIEGCTTIEELNNL